VINNNLSKETVMKFSDGYIVQNGESIIDFQEKIHEIRYQLYEELRNMGNVIGLCVSEYPLKNIYTEIESRLNEILRLYRRRRIDPCPGVICSSLDKHRNGEHRKMRIGIFPVDADPIHWGHLLIGLSAMAKLALDQVVYIVSGAKDHKPDMVQPVVRHAMARSVLKMFDPLLRFSDVGLGYAFDDMTNFFRFLNLNQKQKIEAVYISGLDHTAEDVESGNTDIGSRCRRNSGMENHTLSTAIIPRQSQPFDVNQCGNFAILPEVPFEVSSTLIRLALQGREDDTLLSYLPYTAYVDIRAFGLYGEVCPVDRSEEISRTEMAAVETV